MKKFILTFVFALIATLSFAQSNQFQFRPNIDLTQYEIVDSLPLERFTFYVDKEINDDRLIALGSGYYMAPLHRQDNIIIKTNKDRTKAIILYNSYCFGRRYLEFTIQENDRRIVFYNQDDKGYCGYIYDKYYKVAKYFDSKKEYKRIMKRPFFNDRFNRP